MLRQLSLIILVLLSALPVPVRAGPYFEDGYLGLTQTELRAMLGPPQAVRDRKAALRTFRYYSLSDWESYFKKMLGPENGEDVYLYKRGGMTVRYSFGYARDLAGNPESPTLYVRLVDIEFPEPVPMEDLPAMVPEFKPPTDAAAPAFRSNLMVLLFKGSPNPAARTIVLDPWKERFDDWTLAYQMFSLQGLPDYFTLKVPVDRLEISTQSVEFVRRRQRLTHEPVLNPFSPEFTRRPPPPPSVKKIPVPKYSE